MSAVTTTVFALVTGGDHVIYSSLLYRNSTRFFAEVLPRYGIEVTCVDVGDVRALREAIRPRTRLVFYEIPTNLFLRVPNLPAVVKACRREGSKPLVVVDSTFATPMGIRPLEHGADLVVHSLTKYLAGHDDLLAGCVCGSHDLLRRVCAYRDVLGGICDPHNTFLCMRSLKTFALRMERLNKNGMGVARFLRRHPQVREVHYPGLRSHPDYGVAKRLLRGFGSVMYFRLQGGERATKKFIESLRLPFIGTNFGGVHTFVEPFSQLTFGKVTRSERKAIGVGEDLIRLCVGIENLDDIIDDLKRALETK
jgi:cystathionine beta-lyase/cystathionine gamma-synthase